MSQAMGNIFIISYIFLHCNLLHLIRSQIVIVYTNTGHRGFSTRARIKNCSNLPDIISQRVSSVDTLDNCVRLFSGKNCNGESVEILPNSPSHHDLKYWRFDDTARSVGPCRDPCDANVTGIYPLKPFQVQLFSETDFEGSFKKLSVSGCTVLPDDIDIPIVSLNTNGYCIQAYNNIKCETDSVGFDNKSVELRSGTPFHDNFEKWDFPGVKAISHCAYKCAAKPNVTYLVHGNMDKNLSALNQSQSDYTLHMTNQTILQPISEKGNSYPWPLHILLITIGVPIVVSVIITLLAILIVMRRYLPKANIVKILPDHEMPEIRNNNAVVIDGNQSTVGNHMAATSCTPQSGFKTVGVVYI